MASSGLLFPVTNKTDLYDCYLGIKKKPEEMEKMIKERKAIYFCDNKGNPLPKKVAVLQEGEIPQVSDLKKEIVEYKIGMEQISKNYASLSDNLNLKENKLKQAEKENQALIFTYSAEKARGDFEKMNISEQNEVLRRLLEQSEKQTEIAKKQLEDSQAQTEMAKKQLEAQTEMAKKQLEDSHEQAVAAKELLAHMKQVLSIGEIPFRFQNFLTSLYNELTGKNEEWGPKIYNEERFRRAMNKAFTGDIKKNVYFPSFSKVKAWRRDIAHPILTASNEVIDSSHFSEEIKEDLKRIQRTIESNEWREAFTQEFHRLYFF